MSTSTSTYRPTIEAIEAKHSLTDRQDGALRAIAELGSGVAVRKGTADALVRRGLATITGDAVMSAGVSMQLTALGLDVAEYLVRDTMRQREIYGLSNRYNERALAIIARKRAALEAQA